ncbi:MAG: PDZ domain-containing protein, partial [Phycisphaerales bacterium]|nr:PDZ domain-containing protein [Phycisphaerales bacterium]
MQILHSARTPLFALALVATTMVCGVHASSTIDGVRAAEDSSVDQWSAMLWQAAIDGDRDRVDTLLMETPAISGMSYDAFRGQLRDWNDHQSDARDYVESRKLEIREELPASLDEDDLIEALRLAVEFQTLSEDYDTVLLDPMIIRTITDAKAKLPGVLESHDWLYAQEILLRLRTLYEDTAFTDTYDDYDRQMDANGRRMALLRRYAREELYELFIKRGERIGKPLTDPFNNALSNRWQQEVEHIDLEMVADALGTAQAEHVNNSGWDPLYDGGFDALEVLAATTALKATFPALGDPVQVQAWQDGLDRIESEVDAQYETGRSPFRVNAWCFASLDQLNDETIDLPDSVLWREFGEGALESLDRYTSIIWPYDITEFNRQMEGKFIGVGIMITENEVGDIEVVQPLEGKPAYNAGLQPDDRIVEVDGQSTAGWSVQDAVHFITGPQHTTVTLGIEREGSDEVLYFPVDRDII